MVEARDVQKMTLAQQMDAARNRQASFRLEAEVRAAVCARDLDVHETEALVEKARGAFVFANAEP